MAGGGISGPRSWSGPKGLDKTSPNVVNFSFRQSLSSWAQIGIPKPDLDPEAELKADPDPIGFFGGGVR